MALKRGVEVWVFGIVLLFGLIGAGCGKGETPAPSKDLFSVWTADDNSEIIDLRGMTFGVGMHMGFQAITGERCYCNLSIGGSQASATALLGSCAYTGGGSGDPGCSSLNQAYTLTNSAAILRLCNASNSCTTYH